MNITTSTMSETQELKDIRLVIKIDNKQPVELMDLTRSLVSLASEFNTYVAKSADSKGNREAKLYVKEIKTGSVILELIEIATVGMIPFLENVNTIVGFADYCKTAFNYFLKNEGEKPEMSVSELRDMSQIVNPIAKDQGSQINFSTTINGNVSLHFNLNSVEANAFQNIAKREIEKLVAPEILDEVKSKVLLYWFQARNDLKSKVGNKAVIEELSETPVNVIFEDDTVKEQMIHDHDNPFLKIFVVDVKMQSVKGKLAAYKIVKLHESFDKTTD